MNKDLVVFLPSRGSPLKFNQVVEMLYDTCTSRENFDIVAIIDDDETDLYSEVINKYPEIIYKHPAHGGPLGQLQSNVMKSQIDFIEATDYYFNWSVVDDFWGLHPGWDLAIINKKGIFDDGYFTMYTTNPLGRNLNALASQYRKAWHWFDGDKKPIVTDPVLLIHHYHDMLPVCTKKWRLAMNHFLDHSEGSDIVFLCASLAHILSVEHGYSRLIAAGIYYEGLQDNYNASESKVGDLTRDEQFYKFAREENFAASRREAKIVADQIWQHYRDIMDEARSIGKFKKKINEYDFTF